MPTEGGGGPSKELKKRQKGKIPPIFFPRFIDLYVVRFVGFLFWFVRLNNLTNVVSCGYLKGQASVLFTIKKWSAKRELQQRSRRFPRHRERVGGRRARMSPRTQITVARGQRPPTRRRRHRRPTRHRHHLARRRDRRRATTRRQGATRSPAVAAARAA